MDLEIVTPEKTIFEGKIDELYVNTADGPIGIFPHHVNLFSKLAPGELKMKISGKDQYMALTSGFIEISDNKVTILADYAIPAEEIQIEKAMEAKKRSEEILKKKESQLTEQEFAAAEAAFRQAIAELKVAERRHKKPLQ